MIEQQVLTFVVRQIERDGKITALPLRTHIRVYTYTVCHIHVCMYIEIHMITHIYIYIYEMYMMPHLYVRQIEHDGKITAKPFRNSAGLNTCLVTLHIKT